MYLVIIMRRRLASSIYLLMTYGLCLAVSACAYVPWDKVTANPWAAYAPDEAQVVQAGWYPRGPRPQMAPRYCYRTLAKPDCYAEPQADEAARQIGWFDAPVAD